MHESHATAELAAAYLEGQITDEQLHELRDRLGSEADARRAFIVTCLQTQLMRETFAPERQAAIGVQGSGFRVQRQNTPTLRRSRSVWYTALAAALIALAITAWFLLPWPEPRAAQRSDASQSSARTPNPGPSTPPASIATLIDSHNARFANTAAPMQLGQPLPPGPIKLTAGTAQVMFASTAVVDLTGPCEFEMTGPNRGRLTAGGLEAFVPQSAKGFTIDLPDGSKIIDLGTAFRIYVGDDGDAELRVTEGKVEWTTAPGSVVGAEPVTVVAGQFARMVGGRPVINAARLIAHWKLDGDFTDSAGSLDMKSWGEPEFVSGVFGQAVRLQGKDRAFAGDSPWPVAPGESHSDFAISAWVNPTGMMTKTRGDGSVVVGFWAREGPFTGLWLNGLATSPQAVALMKLDADRNRIAAPRGSVPLGQWTHLLLTVSREEGSKLYVNGELTASNASVVAAAAGDDWWISDSFYIGSVDDVAIFDRPLNPSQVRNVYRFGAEAVNRTPPLQTIQTQNHTPASETADR